MTFKSVFIVSALLTAVVISGCSSTQDSSAPGEGDSQENISISPSLQESLTQQVATELADTEASFSVTKSLAPEEVDDVWQRIRMQLQFPESDHKRVQQRVAWYLKHPNYMHTISERASPFLHYLVTEVEKRGLPIEIALMPLIESDFNTEAYSHKQASGLWQLTPYIARHFGVHMSNWYDGRQDVIDSTKASLDFFEYLVKRFDGDWYHAIAAYNTGEGRVKTAIRRNQRANKSTDFFSLRLPKETRHFVPKLLAVSQLLRQELMEFPAIDNTPVISILPLNQQTILPGSSDWQDIARLNPGYARFPALIDGGGHIVVPVERVSEWQTMIESAAPLSADNWLEYKIRSGDTLSRIASAHSLTVKQLKEFNQLTSDRIRAGKTLFLPVLADQKIDYKVRSGDSLWQIARRFGISVAKLKQWNSLSTDVLQIGKTLNIFLSDS